MTDTPSKHIEDHLPHDEPCRDELETRKLSLETAILEFRRDLEEEKLRREIDELRQSPRRARRTAILTAVTAALSAVTTLVVAAVSAFITLQVQQFGDRQHATDLYAKLLQDLGSPNVPARAGAVVGLSPFAVGSDPDRSAQTITILVTQLTTETDPKVLRILLHAIVYIGTPAIKEVSRVNKAATVSLINEVQRMVISKMPSIQELSKIGDGSRGRFLVTRHPRCGTRRYLTILSQ
jgi:hypothetical protein